MKENQEKARKIAFVALFVAMIAIISQISIPMPSGVPMTLQILIIAFTGYYLGVKKGFLCVFIYILLGAVGAPVFASFKGGFYVFLGPSGGFIWGFLVMAVLCGLCALQKKGILLGVLSVILCHFIGVIQYAIVSGSSLWSSFLIISLPYIIKDIICVVLAYILAIKISKRIKS